MKREARRTGALVVALLAACSGDSGPAGAAGVGVGAAAIGAAAAGGATTGAGGSGSSLDPGPDGGIGVADGGPSAGPTGILDGGWSVPDELQLCGGPCQCADGVDNDGDGVADGFDSECTGPGDNDEGTFATGIPGDNRDPKWQDCFFDGNSGAGDDDCRYATGCLTGDLPPDDADCTVTQECVDFCKARTPNGCDCFGCCGFALDNGETIHVLLEASCEEEHLDKCTKCIPSEGACVNTCGRCELCPGKSVADLPTDCGTTPPTGGSGGAGGNGTGGTGTGGSGGTTPPPGTPYTCDDGVATCTSTRDCASGLYCSYGCCLVLVF